MVRLQDDGTGLGLAIASELIHTMHGEIGVISQEGYGSTFWVELPLPRQKEDRVPDRLAAQPAEGE
jgi:signal transduction histidine kinase